MRWRQIVVLWLVCGALAADWLLVERRRPEETSAPDVRPRFLPLAAADVREMSLRRGNRVVVARRDGDAWGVVEPAGASIPSGLVAAFANALAEAEEIAHVAGAGADPHGFGLAEGASHVELRAGAAPPVAVTMGDTNPAGTAVYAQRDGAPDVVLIGRQVRYYEDLIFQALSAGEPPAAEEGAPIG